ncbi:hypothetical protein LPJ61_007075 [Coemansia biformis]|uniref:Acetyl-CoA synthetase-like protein n=1 Tax=Coemansia biformis TaxID=1286918 RepID=A0A9W7XRV4_9FUNG|nr:hypothetical protein LPJ61_007075 [Coemansia biformis]
MSPGFVAKVIDTEGNETDGYGELCLSSPQIATHYANGNPIPLTDDGYLRTGDYVHLTADGQLRVIGRLCELCHTPEGLVCPADIDNELAQHPAVCDSIVVARSEGGSVRPVALVVPTPLPDMPAQLRDIEQSIRERMGIAIECREVPQIPRSSAGKPIWPLVNAMVS